MSFAAPLGLLGLLAVPMVLVLHYYRRRLPERRVAALFLYAERPLQAASGRTRSRLLRSPSLWCELLAALLFGLWLAAPVAGGSPTRHLVVVLDDSASMQAGGAANARIALQQATRQLAAADRLTVLRSGEPPETLLGPRARPAELSTALERWQPRQGRHDVLPALRLAIELSEPGDDLRFFTDEPIAVVPDGIAVEAFGRAEPNAAILVAERGLGRDGGEVARLRVGGFAGLTATTLSLRLGNQELPAKQLDLSQGPVELEIPLGNERGPLHASLATDSLLLDNDVWLLGERIPVVAIADLLPANRRNNLGLERALAAIAGHRPVPSAAMAQLILTERPGSASVGQLELVLPPPAGEPSAYAGPFAIDRSHPWVDGLALQGVVVQCSPMPLPGQALIAVGPQALLSEEFLPAGRRLWLNLDASAGNFVRSPDWPLLLANLIESCRSEVPGPERRQLRLGEELRFRRDLADPEQRAVQLRSPQGDMRAGSGNRTVAFLPDTPGLHAVVDASGRVLAEYAVRFLDPAESDLQRLRSFTTPAVPVPAIAAATGDDLWLQRLLLLCLVIALLADWWWLAGRPS